MRRAALRNLDVLPIVFYAPTWARAYRNRFTSPPKSRADYVTYLAALVERYGPDGTFWTDHPELPKHPLREWQIWNEPHLPAYWDAPEKGPYGYARAYPLLLRASYNIVKSLDPGAKIVLAGITQRAWEEIEVLYQHGIKRYFDVAALQIFPQTVQRAVKATALFRDAMNRRGDGRKPIYLTEITWPASKGRTERIKYQRQETPRGMAAKLGQMYRAMVGRRSALGAREGVLVHVVVAVRARRQQLQLRRAHALRRQRLHGPAGARAPTSGARAASRAARRRSPASASRGLFSARQASSGSSASSIASAVRRQVSSAARSRPAVDQPVALGARGLEQRGREGLRVVGVGEQRGAAAGLGQRGAVGGHDRGAGRHRLDARQAEALVERRHGEGGGARVEGGQVGVVHVADPPARLRCRRWGCTRASSRRSTTSSPLAASSRRDRVEQARGSCARPRCRARARRGGRRGPRRREHAGPGRRGRRSAGRRPAGSPRTRSAGQPEQLDQLRAHELRRRDHEPRAAGDAAGAARGARRRRRARTRTGSRNGAASWITHHVARMGQRREVRGREEELGARAPSRAARAAPRRGPRRCASARGRPDDGVALGTERGQQDRASSRAQRSTPPISRRAAARALIATGARRQETRRRSVVPAARRSAPVPASSTAGRPVRGKRRRAVSCEATAGSAPAAGGARRRRGSARAPGPAGPATAVRLLDLAERVGVLLVAGALGERGGRQREHGSGEKQGHQAAHARRRVAATAGAHRLAP